MAKAINSPIPADAIPPGQLDTKKMAAALEKFGIEVLGPPPSLSR